MRGVWLGRRRYAPVHELQLELQRKRSAGEICDTVLLLEHEPVITLGRGASSQHVLLSREALSARGVDSAETGRGGDVTLHAPGQLICYPILDLSPDRRDVRRYVADLADTMRRLVALYGIEARPFPGYIGLWVDAENPRLDATRPDLVRPEKIGAIGVRISRWVTMHGFALNLTTDLSLFGLIVPCGVREYGVTSVERLVGLRPSVCAAAEQGYQILADTLGAASSDLVDASELAIDEVASLP
jgi:lipoyl(octanoyl) transferase